MKDSTIEDVHQRHHQLALVVVLHFGDRQVLLHELKAERHVAIQDLRLVINFLLRGLLSTIPEDLVLWRQLLLKLVDVRIYLHHAPNQENEQTLCKRLHPGTKEKDGRSPVPVSLHRASCAADWWKALFDAAGEGRHRHRVHLQDSADSFGDPLLANHLEGWYPVHAADEAKVLGVVGSDHEEAPRGMRRMVANGKRLTSLGLLLTTRMMRKELKHEVGILRLQMVTVLVEL
mmetsp:Transcript_48600/g.114029  ORF Transcript_48600/g.114029 Transcript_48600/m.114029 type:complete len:232 (-) Transcript_48600:354-1049(-)